MKIKPRPHHAQAYRFLRMLQETISSREHEIQQQAAKAVAAMTPRCLPLAEILQNGAEGNTLDWSLSVLGKFWSWRVPVMFWSYLGIVKPPHFRTSRLTSSGSQKALVRSRGNCVVLLGKQTWSWLHSFDTGRKQLLLQYMKVSHGEHK